MADPTQQSALQSIRDQAREARLNPAAVRYAQWLAAAIIITGALDAASTDMALATGMAVEANPIIAALQALTGPYWVLPKMIVHGLLAAGVVWFPNRLTLGAMTGVATLVFAVSLNNFRIFADAIGWI